MKTPSIKEFASHAVIAVAALVFAFAVLTGARTLAGAGNEFLMLSLTLCGAVLSGINGFGRRTVKADFRMDRNRRGPQSGVALTS